MAVSSQYVLHGIQNGASFLSQISNARRMPGVEYLIGTPAGLPNPMFVANIGTNPTFNFDTSQLTTLLGFGGTGAHLMNLSGSNTDLFFKKTTNLSTREADASTVHIRERAAMACLSVNQIRAGHRSEAVASCGISCLYNGSVVPLVSAGSLALAGTPSSAVHWIAGKCTFTVAGPVTTVVAGVQDISVDFNRQVSIAGGEGEQYATHAFEQQAQPVITLRCLDSPGPTIGMNGLALIGFSVTFRKCDTTGPIADATAQHIRFYGTAGLITIEETGAGGNEPAMSTIRITTVAPSATTEPMTIDTASAIP